MSDLHPIWHQLTFCIQLHGVALTTTQLLSSIIATRYSTASLFVLFLILRANQPLLSSAEVLPSGYLVLDAQLFLLSAGNCAVQGDVHWRIRLDFLNGFLIIQGGSNMTGTDLCVNKCKQSRSYLNHLVFQVPVCSGEMQLMSTNTHSEISFYCADIKLQHWLTEHDNELCGTEALPESLGVNIICCMGAELTKLYLRRHAVGHILSLLTIVTSCSSVTPALIHPPTS